MRDKDLVEVAHDVIGELIVKHQNAPLHIKTMLASQMDVLCWVLGHGVDFGKFIAANADEGYLHEAGYVPN